jgi:3-deoxy-manno-octulosonate cytidylyltransferase (CMP-KDO synthetase)
MPTPLSILTLIPSRLASTRFPNKPLADIHGKPMIVRAYEQALLAGVGKVFVASGDAEINAAVEAHGGQAILTDPALPSGSDRIWAATQTLIAGGHPQPDIIINAQGDEPLLPPELITQAIAAFATHPQADVITFAHPITNPDELTNPTKVKVVCAEDGRALYFSRAGIPHGASTMLRHIGFYAYRYAALQRSVSAPPSPLELQEKLEQLRGLEMGLTYYVLTTHHEPVGVDTPADLAHALTLFKP